ncbi:cell division protein ZapB [Ectothiorhodospira magna]|uniref:Cell division protein ZapB n=1 Tax=Ectothiorhodospira magna TaxID=867345 RepID=A0A1H8ZD62_9GAMM|nr:TIGR02449 family protein [Ectothiorhodospira magna]SEP62344.1 cell division protein ZapB [Ectothiorhodospira magna]
MTYDPHHAPADAILRNLEFKVEALLRVCQLQREENHRLRRQNELLLAERAQLSERSERARIKVESMIHRLKSMEQA